MNDYKSIFVHYSVDFLIVIFTEMMQIECSSDVAVEVLMSRMAQHYPQRAV